MFAERLAAFGVTVSGEVTRATAAATANTLATGESRPVAALVEQMLTDSDNTSAEMLAHLLGGKVAGEASFAGGAKAVTSEITRLGVPTAGLLVLDGSGLSTADRVAPPRCRPCCTRSSPVLTRRSGRLRPACRWQASTAPSPTASPLPGHAGRPR